MILFPGYTIQDTLATTARTSVYRAVRDSDGLPVVLKALTASAPSQADLASWRHSWALTRGVEHENVVRSLDLVEVERRPVLVMEDIGGQSLRQRAARGDLTLDGILSIGAQIAAGLAWLHARGILHKDVNPYNVIVNAQGRVQLIDFDLASPLPRDSAARVTPSQLEGTLAYISPEQTGRMMLVLDQRSDLYSLGVTLYELLTGAVPFTETEPLSLIHRHIATLAPPLRARAPAVPGPVADVVMRLLAKTPEGRYQSAAGLRWDLNQLRDMLAAGQIEPFPLGSHDHLGRIQLSHRLVGREADSALLAEAVRRVKGGAAELWLVGGYAGVGKSSLIHGVQRPAAEVSARYAESKYEQIQNLPNAGVVEIIGSLLRDLLAEPEAAQAAARARLLEALGGLAGVVVQAAPLLALLLGEQPAPPVLPPQEAQNRFNLAMVRFFQGLASEERPLILFGDDLQWADGSTLQLFRALIADPATHHLLLLGAYRDHEIGLGHALTRLIEGLAEDGRPAGQIHLGALDERSVARVVAEALGCPVEESAPLAALLAARTGGNPFFLERLLKTLYDEALLVCSPETGRWSWDLDAVARMGISDDVADLMAGALLRLPEPTRLLLQPAACIGSTFDLETLAVVVGRPAAEVAGALIPALASELIAPVGGAWRYAGELSPDTEKVSIEVGYRFVHDRVQEAALRSLAVAERPALHWRIGQRLLARLPEDCPPSRLLDAIGQLNMGSALASTPEQRQRLARLNLRAMNLARDANAFEAAAGYGRVGGAHLDAALAEAEPDLALDLWLGLADSARLSGDVEQAATAVERAAELARTTRDLTRLALVRLPLAAHQSRFQEAVDIALDALALHGRPRPVGPEALAEAAGRAHVAAEAALAGREPASLADLPPMDDQGALAQMEILGAVISASAVVPSAFSLFLSWMIELSATRGVNPQSPTAYVFFGYMAAIRGEYGRAVDFGELALRLSERLDTGRAICEQMFATFVCSWRYPFREAISHIERAIGLGLETGALLPASWAVMNQTGLRIVASEEIGAIIAELGRSLTLVRTTLRMPDTATFLYAMRHTLLHLRGPRSAEAALAADGPSEAEVLDALQHYAQALLGVRIARLEVAVLLGDLPWALSEVELLLPLLPYGMGVCYYPDAVLYLWLARAASWASASEPDRASWRDGLDAALTQSAAWAAAAPANHAGRHQLLLAERARMLGDQREAAERYDLAITAAREGGMLAIELAAAERCGLMYLSAGRPLLAQGYLAEARFAAVRLGAEAVVARLEREHPALVTARTDSTDPTSTSRSSSSLDLYATIEATKTISAEIELEHLLERTLRLLLAEAGAERVALILLDGEEPRVQAEGRAGDAQPAVLCAVPLAESQDLPVEAIRVALRTGEDLLLADAMSEGPLRNNAYIRRAGVRSLLVAPLTHQGKALGVIYLENTLTPGAFTPERVTLIRLLGAQVATSLENALLYERLRARSAELLARNEQLRELDRMRDEFLARTSHELRTPLHGIIGLAQSLMGAEGRSSAERGSLGMIVQSGRRLSNLLGDLLDLSTLQRKELSLVQGPVGLGALVASVLTLCGPLVGRKELLLHAEVPEDLPLVYADPNRVEQVLFNLVGNAIKFTERGSVLVRAAVDGDAVRVTVADTGRGIAPEALERIFEPFTQEDGAITRRYGGTGIGLSVAREIVRLHGGTLSVSSTAGEGSAFTFTLPLARGAMSLVAAPTRGLSRPLVADVEPLPLGAARSGGTGFAVMVVDDEPINLSVLIAQLGQAGYRVETFTGGAEALARLREGYRPDIVLLDVMMPQMDGLELCRAIRAQSPPSQLPIIMVTARVTTDDLVVGLQSGANDYVTKPFSSEELLARMRTHLWLARIHRAVSLFVPYPVMRLLGRDSIVDLRLGDSVEQEMAVLFADLASFTTLVERMSPAECFEFINAFLAAVVPQVSAAGGFVDRFVGDGVLALFPGGADGAVRCALGMIEAVGALSARRQAAGQAPVALGVGVHTGRLMLGTVGDQSMMQATVLSDAVNLASRLTGLTKHYGASVLISQETRDGLARADGWSMRDLDRVQVRGRSALVRVYEVMDADPPERRAAKEATRPSFESAVRLFHDRAFNEAQRLFRLVLAMDPDDAVSLQYLERCGTIQRQLAGDTRGY